MERRYHVEIGFPNGIQLPTGLIDLVWTEHADARRFYPPIPSIIPAYDRIPMDRAEIFEIVTRNGELVKFAMRLPWRYAMDICMVLAPVKNTYKVVTVWLNHELDRHMTLDRTRYDRP